MKRLFPILALLLASPLTAQQVDVGNGDWSALPWIDARARDLPTPAMVDGFQRLLATKECSFDGQRASRFSYTLPFVMQIGADGSVDRVVVRDVGCPYLERNVGAMLLERAERGDYRARGSKAGWYKGSITFELR
jgi:hypothetical protein